MQDYNPRSAAKEQAKSSVLDWFQAKSEILTCALGDHQDKCAPNLRSPRGERRVGVRCKCCSSPVFPEMHRDDVRQWCGQKDLIRGFCVHTPVMSHKVQKRHPASSTIACPKGFSIHLVFARHDRAAVVVNTLDGAGFIPRHAGHFDQLIFGVACSNKTFRNPKMVSSISGRTGS